MDQLVYHWLELPRRTVGTSDQRVFENAQKGSLNDVGAVASVADSKAGEGGGRPPIGSYFFLKAAFSVKRHIFRCAHLR